MMRVGLKIELADMSPVERARRSRELLRRLVRFYRHNLGAIEEAVGDERARRLTNILDEVDDELDVQVRTP